MPRAPTIAAGEALRELRALHTQKKAAVVRAPTLAASEALDRKSVV